MSFVDKVNEYLLNTDEKERKLFYKNAPFFQAKIVVRIHRHDTTYEKMIQLIPRLAYELMQGIKEENIIPEEEINYQICYDNLIKANQEYKK